MKIDFRFGSLSVILTVLFVGLKLTGYIAWGWLWVVSPLWIPFAFWMTVLVFALFMAAVTGQLKR